MIKVNKVKAEKGVILIDTEVYEGKLGYRNWTTEINFVDRTINLTCDGRARVGNEDNINTATNGLCLSVLKEIEASSKGGKNLVTTLNTLANIGNERKVNKGRSLLRLMQLPALEQIIQSDLPEAFLMTIWKPLTSTNLTYVGAEDSLHQFSKSLFVKRRNISDIFALPKAILKELANNNILDLRDFLTQTDDELLLEMQDIKEDSIYYNKAIDIKYTSSVAKAMHTAAQRYNYTHAEEMLDTPLDHITRNQGAVDEFAERVNNLVSHNYNKYDDRILALLKESNEKLLNNFVAIAIETIATTVTATIKSAQSHHLFSDGTKQKFITMIKQSHTYARTQALNARDALIDNKNKYDEPYYSFREKQTIATMMLYVYTDALTNELFKLTEEAFGKMEGIDTLGRMASRSAFIPSVCSHIIYPHFFELETKLETAHIGVGATIDTIMHMSDEDLLASLTLELAQKNVASIASKAVSCAIRENNLLTESYNPLSNNSAFVNTKDSTISGIDTISRAINGNYHRIIEYLFFSLRLEQGISVSVSGYLDTYADYIAMSRQVADTFEKYPSSLATKHDIVARNFNMLKLLEPDDESQDTLRNTVRQRGVTVPKNYSELLLDGKEEDGIYFVLPKTPREIVEEGNNKGHCVASYVPRVVNGKCLIGFIRQKGDEIASHGVTIEITPNGKGIGTVSQARMRFNASPTGIWSDSVAKLKTYLRKNHIVFAY